MTSNMSVSGKQDLKKDERMMVGKRSDSPEPSCVSMKSDQSMDRPINFRDSSTDVSGRSLAHHAEGPGLTPANASTPATGCSAGPKPGKMGGLWQEGHLA
ncbi:hypothetical protein QTP70_032323 [Hemibagrus guttatus]|uniref:Uncharacterized protein n=1 Tax=Hemibagrus guttatus TaxID=175788 RepID=A0AAE0Q9P8_9TELE|nr:hypothetical protein QTP70_032323 [Hemibagrus guttatus]